MAAVKVSTSTMWTAFTTAVRALLAALGFTVARVTAALGFTAAQATAVHPAYAPAARPAEPPAAATAAPATRWSPATDRALPPTMKQRIRAEAHGSSPAARHLPTDLTETARTDLRLTA
ncbi:DUF6344 domain-containing protein [Streptomyces hypolithicus]